MDASASTNQKTERPASSKAVGVGRALGLLSQGQIELVGQVLESSNTIFIVRVNDGELESLAIYKPRQGERPLWDFDHGTLCLREVATFLLSQALGWPLVPPTVLRDGPYGPGALQLYIEADYEANYFTFREERLADLLPVALFDVLVNNADRKGGHLLLDQSKRIWAIDNALTFHTEPKLRTVIWDLSGEAIPEEYLADLRRLQKELVRESALREALGSLLTKDEVTALQDRLAELLESAKLPYPDPTRRQVPWPMV